MLRRPVESALAAPVVTELDSSGDIGSQATDPIDDRVIDRLEGGEAVAHLGHVRPGFVGVVVEEHEHPHPAVVLRPGHCGVGAPADIGGIGDHPSIVEARTAALGRSLRCEQPRTPHQAQHPVLASVDLMVSPQPSSHLAVALSGKGAVHDHLADRLGELVVADVGLGARSAPGGLADRTAVIDRGSGRTGDPADGGQGDLHLGAHLGRFCGGI